MGSAKDSLVLLARKRRDRSYRLSPVLRGHLRTDIRRLDIIHENRPDRSLFRDIIDVSRRRLCTRYYTQIASDKSSGREAASGPSRGALAFIVTIPQLCPNSSGRHLQDTAAPPRRYSRHACWRASLLLRRFSLRLRPFIPPFFQCFPPSHRGSLCAPSSLSCGRELLLSNDTERRQRIPDLFIRPSDYNVSVIPRDNLSRQRGEAVPREFIDGCSCVPYGAVAVHREVSAGHVLNRLLVTVKSEGAIKRPSCCCNLHDLPKIQKWLCI